MNMFKKIIFLIIIAIMITGCSSGSSKSVLSSPDKICLEEGNNDLILEAIAKKYPQSKIVEVYDSFSPPMGPYWELKIEIQSGEIATELIECWRHYSIDECNGDNQCYTQIASFYHDVEVCKKITDSHTKNNCFALLAGLSPQNNWDPSICEKLSDKEAKLGCMKFFEED